MDATRLLLLAREATPGPGAATDAELLRRYAAARDEAAFAELVRRNGPVVLRACRHALGEAAADDAFQATFLLLARSAGRLARPGSLAGWLHAAAVRVARRARRGDARRRVREAVAAASGPAAAADELSWGEVREVLDRELAALPERYRAPLVLCHLQELSYEEAAGRLGCPVGALRGRLERGREQLRRRLARYGLPMAAPALILGPPAPVSAALAEVTLGIARAALTGGSVPAAVVKLVGRPHALRAALLTPVAVALAAAGAVWAGASRLDHVPPQAPPPRPVAPDAAAGPADRFGDPLPAGAVLRLGTTRLRQPRAWALAFEPGGPLVGFGGDYVARAWDPATGRLLRAREFEQGRVSRQRGGWLSADAGRLAVQQDDRVRVYDARSGRELAAVALTNVFDAVARFSPDGNQLAVTDEAGRVRVCDVAANTTRELAKLGGSASLELAFSRDGGRLALANFSAGAVVWDLANDRELLRFKPAGLAPVAVDFDAAGEVLAVLGANPGQSLHFVEVATGRAPAGWAVPPAGGLNWARFAPDGSALVLGGGDGVTWFDPKAGKTTRTAAGAAAVRPAFSADGRLVASGGENELRVWDARTGRPAVPEPLAAAPAGEVNGVAVSPDGKWILTHAADPATIRVWDQSGAQKGVVPSSRWAGRCPAFSPDGKHLYGTAPDALALVRRDLPGGGESARYAFADPAAQVAVLNTALSADGRRLAALTQTTGGGAGRTTSGAVTLTVWDTGTGRRVESRGTDDPGFLSYGAFTPDLRWYAYGGRALALVGGPDLRLEVPRGWLASQAAASPDGRFVAQAFGEQVREERDGRPWVIMKSRGVMVHELATGARVLALPTGPCGPIAFTPDGRGLVVTGPDGIARWDLVAQAAVVRHPAPGRFGGSYGESFASSLAVAPGGATAVTGHVDTTALVWDLTPPPLRPRPLTEGEMLAAWDELAGADAGKAYAAARALADTGGAVAFLSARLRPAASPPADRVRGLVAQLGAEVFADREAAERELRELGDAAVPALRAAANGELSAEQARRVGYLLTAAGAPAVRPGDRLRGVRAVGVLEWVATKDARDLLVRLAGGVEDARLTREAKAAVARVREQPR